jgi:dipeptidyl aminopeptidase/acylaminoacyl peptidase
MAWFLVLVLAACAPGPNAPTGQQRGPSPIAAPSRAPSPEPTPSPSPRPNHPSYYIESLRERSFAGGKLEVQEQMWKGAGFTKYRITWPSLGQTMTGTVSIPDGPGPFPVVVVNHGYIPANRYWIGQDSWIFGDPLAAHGFISVTPDYPGHAGSGPGAAEMPFIVGDAITVLDLVGSLSTLAQADTARIAMMGHSNGGGISLLAMVVDPRIKAFAIYAPASSEMADNARKWWFANGSMGPLGHPDTNPEGYRHISPRYYFEARQRPAIFFQGTADTSVPPEWTQATVRILEERGAKTKLVMFPGAAHDMVGADLDSANQQAEAWIRAAL